jgi:DNA-binding CsgD family transcriptional regulator
MGVDSGMPARLLELEGRWAAARRRGQEALDLGYLVHSTTRHALTALAALARAQGDAPLAWTAVRALVAAPDVAPGNALFQDGLAAQRTAAALTLDAGDLPQAHAWLEAHDRWLVWSGAVLGRAEGQLGWAAYHRAGGDPLRARQSAERALALAAAPRQPLALLAAHRLLGELATAAGRHAEAAAHLAAALTLAGACAAPYERALTLLALAELSVSTGAPYEAQRYLADVRAICTPLGARRALDRADAVAAALTGAPPPVPAYPAGLTAREAEVLRLVARGLPDAQVAERLFVSVNTVHAHLRAIYGKLGVRSRSAATRFALEHHLG